jgi:hypothetical protein
VVHGCTLESSLHRLQCPTSTCLHCFVNLLTAIWAARRQVGRRGLKWAGERWNSQGIF